MAGPAAQLAAAVRGGFDSGGYLVDVLPESAAKAFVLRYHYSGAYPAAVNRCGLFDVRGDRPELVGVAVFGVPVQPGVLTGALPTLESYRQSQELSRFVLLDQVPANARSPGSWRAASANCAAPGCAAWSPSPIRCRA